ncbi:hypothetical protein [Nocardioides pakistanensis]
MGMLQNPERAEPPVVDADQAYVDHHGYTWFPSTDPDGQHDGWWVRGVATTSGGHPTARYAEIEEWYLGGSSQ